MSVVINETGKGRATVAALIERCLTSSPLADAASEYMRFIVSGKMLRARMILQLGDATGAENRRLNHAGAAVEMIHAASLLHDDVIDGGSLRRGVPAFWVEHGVQGAILMGDMLMFKAIQLIRELSDSEILDVLIDMTGNVCIAEVEQELVLRGQTGDWETSVSLARRKTGSLFAFSASAAATTDDMRAALKEAGYLIGTAYQLGDDILDAGGDADQAGKSLGSDRRRGKITAATASDSNIQRTVEYIAELCCRAEEQLDPWTELRAAWAAFMNNTINPVLKSYVENHEDRNKPERA